MREPGCSDCGVSGRSPEGHPGMTSTRSKRRTRQVSVFTHRVRYRTPCCEDVTPRERERNSSLRTLPYPDATNWMETATLAMALAAGEVLGRRAGCPRVVAASPLTLAHNLRRFLDVSRGWCFNYSMVFATSSPPTGCRRCAASQGHSTAGPLCRCARASPGRSYRNPRGDRRALERTAHGPRFAADSDQGKRAIPADRHGSIDAPPTMRFALMIFCKNG